MFDIDELIRKTNDDITKINQDINNAMTNANKQMEDINARIPNNIPNNQKPILNDMYNSNSFFNDWKDLFDFYKDSADYYKDNRDYDRAHKCLEKMKEINAIISDSSPVPDSLIDDDLLKPVGGAISIKRKLVNSFGGSSYGSSSTNRGGIYGSGSNQTPIEPPTLNPYDSSSSRSRTSDQNPTTHNTNNKDSNPYNLNFKELTEEDKLEEFINADLPVFLHGKSGCGKSARIKEIDPDCVTIYLAAAKPDMLVGKTIVVDGETKDIPPDWYKAICLKCEQEPDKNHILFFDEITNATPAIQGMAYNIILDKVVNGKWKLPDNVKVVAAGNENKESISANKLSEPLFRRFNHLYIETTLESWLLWASKHNIHLAIYAFVASKGDGKEQVLRTECNGVDPCVDPRKWEMASKLLYKCKNPKALTATIGQKLTEEFIRFCKMPVITLEQVLNGEYDPNMKRLEIDEGYATLIGLAACNDKDIEVVRKFVKKYVIPDQYQNFVMMWTRGDLNRIDKIKELDMLENVEEKGNVR